MELKEGLQTEYPKYEFKEPEEVLKPKFPIHEFMVDFLGGLVPGSLFLLGACVALLPPIYLVFCLSDKSSVIPLTDYFAKILNSTQNTPNMIWVLAFALFVAISYELGHLFFRRDPKNPDIKSFEKLARKAEKEVKKSEYINHLKSEFACTSTKDCQFPYINLRDYIGKRGHCHLCPFVVWKDDESIFHRSKTFINLLKIRLKYHYPQKCSIIIRNEAHIRLASSSWYVAHALRLCSIAGISSVFLCMVIDSAVKITSKSYPIYFPFFIPPIAILLAGEYIRTRIENFIHYQRLREVFYVLETAFTAFRRRRYLLDPPFTGFDDNFSAEKCQDFKCPHNPNRAKIHIESLARKPEIPEEKA